MRKFLLVTAALVAAVVVWAGVTLPPRRISLDAVSDGTVPGIIHVHTTRSDGRGTPDQVAAAAARAGLAFVIFTDHGDGTRAPDPPTYRSGVLCLDGVEISTTGGHYVALDMTPAPYPLGGEARDVIEDVRRLGGFGIVAHPDSPKAALQWRDWTAPFDAIEWLNLDTGWRQYSLRPGWRSRLDLAAALLHYPVRPPETIGTLLGGPGELQRFDALAKRRRIVVLAGADAHAQLALRSTDPGDSRFALPIPAYEATFKTISVHVATERPLTRDAGRDAAMLMRALRAGHAYTAIDAFATPASLAFSATNDFGTVHEGDELGASGPVTLQVRTNAPPGFTTVVLKDGAVLATSDRREISVQAPGDPATYRVEVHAPPGVNGPRWIVSNPIYVRDPQSIAMLPARPEVLTVQPVPTADGWRVEHNAADQASLERPSTAGGELLFRYSLSSGGASAQAAALVFDTPSGVAPNDRLSFTIRSDRPVRVSLQLRVPHGEAAGERWRRSVFVGTFDQERTIYFDEMTPVGETRTWTPRLADVRSVLFVVDTTNVKAGSTGRIWVKDVRLGR